MNNNIYISSVAFNGKNLRDIIGMAIENGWAIEFSSGLGFGEDVENSYLAAPIKKMPHNYFPAPEIPFVLNLASSNDAIRNRSVEHCINGLKLAKQSGAPFFAAHAGFCIDPDHSELGKQLKVDTDFNKDDHWQFFFSSLEKALQIAEKLEIDFLVENNVIVKFNRKDGNNPLLCCENTDVKFLFDNIVHQRLGLLLDTAHLKVSCGTLHLDVVTEFKKLQPYIRAFHHSDNDGILDNNKKLEAGYWFLPFIGQYKNFVHVIEVKNLEAKEVIQQIKFLEQYAN